MVGAVEAGRGEGEDALVRSGSFQTHAFRIECTIQEPRAHGRSSNHEVQAYELKSNDNGSITRRRRRGRRRRPPSAV
jgi:hypothetical protein